MESPERGRPVAGMAMEYPASDGALSCSPMTVPTWLRRRLSEPKGRPPSTVEEIEAKLREADLRRQKFYENLSSKARPKSRSPSGSSSHEGDPGQRLQAKLLAAEEKRLSILANSQMRLAKLDEVRQAAKAQVEMRVKKELAELGTKVERRVRQAEDNRLLLLRAYRQRRATLKERTSQSSLRRIARESKYKERVRAAIFQKRAAAEKKRLGLLEAEKRRARARILQVLKVANSVSHQREIERSEMKNKLEDRLQKARRKRAEYLKQRGRSYNNVQESWDTVHQQADILARKLARCWRKFKELRKTTEYLAKAHNDLKINKRSVKSMPFEHFALLIQSTATLCTTKELLDRLEIRYKLSRSIPSASGCDDIDHLLKRVVSPRKKEASPRKATSSREEIKNNVRQVAKTPLKISRYQVRVVLCAYMILGHPDAVISGEGERETALVKSAEKFVKEFDLLIKILLHGPLQVSDEESDHVSLTCQTFRYQLAAFDSAWCSFLNSFVVWKTKDARSLEEDLVRAACRLELSMIQTCKMTPEGYCGPLSHDQEAIQKQVSEDQKLLREKVLHLSGDAGIERMANALSDTRMKYFGAREDGSSVTPVSKLILSPNPASSSCLDHSDKASNLIMGSQRQSSVVRSLFRDGVNSKEVDPSASSNSISEFCTRSVDMENVIIVNEYVHGEHLVFPDSAVSVGEGDQNDIMARIKETMEKAFWDGIIESVRQDEPNYGRVVELMREVRDTLCVMAPHSWRQEIVEAIDVEILSQVLTSRKLVIGYLGKILEYALITLQKLSAPAYEGEMKKKHQKFVKDLSETCLAGGSTGNSQVIALITGLRFVLEQIHELEQEISKARIRMLEPFLKAPEALYFLGRAFTKRYGHPSNAINSLPLAEKWLLSAREAKAEEWNEHKTALSDLTKMHKNSSIFLPCAVLRTGGSSLLEMSRNKADASSTSDTTTYIETIDPHLECKGDEVDLLVRLGLLNLVSNITGLTEGELPETMKLNLSRLRSVQSRVHKIIVVATSLLVLRQILLGQGMISSQADLESISSSIYKQLSECLDSNADSGIQDIIKILSTAVEENNNLVDTKFESMKEIMARMLTKSLQEGDVIFTRVSRAVYAAARGVVLGGTGKQGKELAEMALQRVGASLLVEEVVRAASVLVVVAKVSVIVHGPWYANLMRE